VVRSNANIRIATFDPCDPIRATAGEPSNRVGIASTCARHAAQRAVVPLRPRSLRAAGVALAVSILSGAAPVRSARAAECSVSAYSTRARSRDEAVLEAGVLASNGKWADARAVYLWMLARRADDAEALFALARLDAWGGCLALAEGEYRSLLAAHPRDADVRAGYVDLLIWRGRIDEAERTLARGLELAPTSPELLVRAARFSYWRGDAVSAVRLADVAEHASPDDGEIRMLRDRLYRGEARATARVDVYPKAYQNLYSLSGQLLQRAGHFEAYAGAQLLERYGAMASAVTDARYPLGVVYHPALGATLGVEVAPGAPSHVTPDISLKGWALAPITSRIDAFFAYAFWHFGGGEQVHIFNPSIGVALPYELRLDARMWVSSVSLPPTRSQVGHSQLVSAGGLQLMARLSPRIDAGIAYTYGAELDQAPTLYQLLTYRSHVGTAFADVLFNRHAGIRPLFTIERRMPPAGDSIVITSLELGGYARW
jgi:tetratricopeptide (TPR) repeat protein